MNPINAGAANSASCVAAEGVANVTAVASAAAAVSGAPDEAGSGAEETGGIICWSRSETMR